MSIAIWKPGAQALEQHIEAICAIGNRFVGTSGEVAARELVAARLVAAGLDSVVQEPVDVLAYRGNGAACLLVESPGLELPAAGMQFSAAGEVQAEAISLGNVRQVDDVRALEDYGIVLEGRIAVIDTDQPDFIGSYLSERGAVGIINVSFNPNGNITHSTCAGFGAEMLDVPAVSVERRAAASLIALMTAGQQTVRITHDCAYERITTANVVGALRGTARPDEFVVVGAHYDTQRETIGAQDNATGLAALFELAKHCVESPFRRSMLFIGFADEEHDLHGSTEFCHAHREQLESTTAMLCFDALAWKYPSRRSLRSTPGLSEYALERCREAGWEPQEIFDARDYWDSDHNAFLNAGVPAAWIWHSTPQHPGYHSVDDTIELLDFERVAQTAAVISHVALSIANDLTLDLGRVEPRESRRGLASASITKPA